MRRRVKSWLNRYLPAEIFATIGALIGGVVVNSIFHNAVLTALGGTWGENLGYYITVVLRDIRSLHKKHKKFALSAVIKLLRNLVFEFGLSECLDSFVVRPFAMYIFPIILHNLHLGLIAGKLAADITFYIPTVVSYELKNKYVEE